MVSAQEGQDLNGKPKRKKGSRIAADSLFDSAENVRINAWRTGTERGHREDRTSSVLWHGHHV